jgi:hypothetical protein
MAEYETRDLARASLIAQVESRDNGGGVSRGSRCAALQPAAATSVKLSGVGATERTDFQLQRRRRRHVCMAPHDQGSFCFALWLPFGIRHLQTETRCHVHLHVRLLRCTSREGQRRQWQQHADAVQSVRVLRRARCAGGVGSGPARVPTPPDRNMVSKKGLPSD